MTQKIFPTAGVSLGLLATLAALALVDGVTHAPPPWRVVRAAPDAATAGPPARPTRPSPLLLPMQMQRQLQQLQQLSRMHLDSWARQVQQQLPQVPSRRLQQQLGEDGGARQAGQRPQPGPASPAAAAEDLATTPKPKPSAPPSVQQEAAIASVASQANEVDSVGGGPSTCVWAIVTCCQPQTTEVRHSCFELLGCPGDFWDGSPCDPAVASAALSRTAKFYGHSAAPSSDPLATEATTSPETA